MWSFNIGFSPASIIFSFSSSEAYITAGSHESDSDEANSDVQICSSGIMQDTNRRAS